MPTEAILPVRGPSGSATPLSRSSTFIKCALCGAGGFSDPTSAIFASVIDDEQDDLRLSLPGEAGRICGGCVRASEVSRRLHLDRRPSANYEAGNESSLGLNISGLRLDESACSLDTVGSRDRVPLESPSLSSDGEEPSLESHLEPPLSSPLQSFSQSLPSHPTRPWLSIPPSFPAIAEKSSRSATPLSGHSIQEADPDAPANRLLSIGTAPVPNKGRGALYPGSVFRGTQTSGRSAYEVEVRFLDVNFASSTLSGYLSISHLTDAHPHLTTFFTAEIIGPKFGFITGAKYGATEHDDMRHWGRFEQFRRPATRGDMLRPELLFRDPLPDRNKGETRAKERDFVFLRIKERFLVPDHTVRDISGASFAGFYYAMIDLAPNPLAAEDTPTPTSPSTPKSPLPPASPTIPRRMSMNASTAAPVPRRMSSSGDARPVRPEGRRRRESSNRFVDTPRPEATIRGYYFHSLNQEPFQELFLSHVPQRSKSTFELR